MAFRLEAAHFSWQSENRVSPPKRRKMLSPVRATYLKRFVAVYRIRRCFPWLFSVAQSVQETGVIADENYTGHCNNGRRER